MSESRQRLYRTEGVVIRHNDVGEADRILTLYTPNRGKVHVVARGVRRPGSRLGGHVELLTHSTFLIARGRNLDIVSQAQTLRAFPALRGDLTRIGWACHLAELLGRMTTEESENYPAFQLLLEALDHLERGVSPELIARAYELHLLGVLGYRPQLFRCVSCQRELEAQEQAFSATMGGVLCPRCRGQDPRARPLSLEALKVLRYLQRNSLDEAGHLRLGNGCRKEVENLLYEYICTILEHDLNAVEFLETLRRNTGIPADDRD